jgi:hypothetical protein
MTYRKNAVRPLFPCYQQSIQITSQGKPCEMLRYNWASFNLNATRVEAVLQLAQVASGVEPAKQGYFPKPYEQFSNSILRLSLSI